MQTYLQNKPFSAPTFGSPINSRAFACGEYRFGFQSMEKVDDISGSGNHYTAEFRENDTRLGRWWSVDPEFMQLPWQSPFVSMGNNPIAKIDPLGNLETDYYDKNTGEHLERVDDGIDEAVGIDKNVFDALKSDNSLTNRNAKQVGGKSLGTNTDFEKISATLYAEAGYINPNSAESAGIYDVLENRSAVSGKTPLQIIEGGGIYGYGSKDYKIALAKGEGYVAKDYSVSRHNAARKGAMLGIVNANSSIDFSQGAYFWDASVYLDKPSSYKSNYFNKMGHGTHIGTVSKNITFSYTTRVGATQFMKYNPSLYPKKTWP
jgi:hypothetical protein